MNDKIRAIKSLEVDDVKIYEARDDKLSVLSRGKLEILYLSEYDRFVLRSNTFKYTLSAKLPIMASLFEERGSFRSYVLPNIGGNFILKLKSVPSPVVLRNLETIFSNNSQFSYQQNQIHDLENQAHRRGDYPLTFGTPSEEAPKHTGILTQSDAINKTSKFIKNGGEILKQNILKAATYIGKNLIHHKEAKIVSQAPNQLVIKSIEELKGLNEAEVQFVDLPKYEAHALVTVGNEIEKLVLSQTEQEKGLHIHPPSNKSFTALKRTAMESAQSLWHGMDGALSTLSHAIKAKRNKGGDAEDKQFIKFKKSKQNEGVLPTQQVGQQPEIDFPPRSLDQTQSTRPVEFYTQETASTSSKLVQQSQQSNVSRFPNIRGEIRGQAKTNHAIQDRQNQYSDATQA